VEILQREVFSSSCKKRPDLKEEFFSSKKRKAKIENGLKMRFYKKYYLAKIE